MVNPVILLTLKSGSDAVTNDITPPHLQLNNFFHLRQQLYIKSASVINMATRVIQTSNSFL